MQNKAVHRQDTSDDSECYSAHGAVVSDSGLSLVVVTADTGAVHLVLVTAGAVLMLVVVAVFMIVTAEAMVMSVVVAAVAVVGVLILRHFYFFSSFGVFSLFFSS